MMYPPIYALVANYAPATALIGSSPVRFWPFATAIQKPEDGSQRPYVVWQTVYGSPENYLGDRPDIDNWGVQIDVYGDSVTQARNVAETIRDALEGASHVVSWNGEFYEPDTNLFRYSFTVEFWTAR